MVDVYTTTNSLIYGLTHKNGDDWGKFLFWHCLNMFKPQIFVGQIMSNRWRPAKALHEDLRSALELNQRSSWRNGQTVYASKMLAAWWLGHPSEKYESQLGWVATQY